MKSDRNENRKEFSRVELKYCEHCGGLWLRECGEGTVYCPNCQPKVAELPIPKKKPQRAILPVRPRTVVEAYDEYLDDGRDFEAAGGVA